MTHRDQELSVARLAMLADPNSQYFSMVHEMLRSGAVTQRRAEEARAKVVLPIVVSVEEKAALETRFGWRLEVRDYGVRGRLPPFVSALVFLMGLRNAMLMGADGEEAIYLDGDLPSLVAKCSTYSHVCRTHASSRLQAGYMFEDIQLKQLSMNRSQSVSIGAKAVLQGFERGDGVRVCDSAATCRRKADTILVNHVMTPVSLMQAVATAKAHCATVVRGVCLFQPEMMYELSGELQAFPGKFIVDKDMDVITFLPREDPSMSFSHPYSSLMSFFLNHEYCDADSKWLVEKHLSGDGVFHYIIRAEEIDVQLSEELSVNYYRAEMTKWVELSYLSYYDEENATVLRTPKRVVVRLLEAVYEKVMPALLSIDVKRLTYEEVFIMLRNHNNTVVFGGDTVKRPIRVEYDVLQRAVVPLLAMATVRRAAASFELSAAMTQVKRQFAIADAGLAALLWCAITAGVKRMSDVALSTVSADDVASLVNLHARGLDFSVEMTKPGEYVTVSHSSGIRREFQYGRMESWLPGRAVRSMGLLARAQAVWSGYGISVGSSSVSESQAGVSVLSGSSTGGQVSDEPVPISVKTVDVTDDDKDLEGARAKLAEKLSAQQDAKMVSKPPRYVEQFEGATRIDVPTVALLQTDPVVAAQDDYDRIYPGVSLSDEEIKPVMAAEADYEKAMDFCGQLNDAKRELPRARVIRRSRIRAGGGGMIPRCQASMFSALVKRNVGVPASRGYVDLERMPGKVVDRIIDVCYVDGWESVLARELEAGLWQPVEADIEQYVPKVPAHQLEGMMREFVSCSDENLSRWLMMAKGIAKPPLDAGADMKVQLPQTIMYSDQKSVNAKYSAMQTRFYKVMRSLLKPNISFNNRDSPAEHEVWFNTCQGLRESVGDVWSFEGDLFCYDRSQEHVALTMELAFYRRHGLDADTLAKWSTTHGVKKATSMMYGIVVYVMMQGISGIWKTLFRNGLICLGAVVYCTGLRAQDVVTLDVTGDDFLLESVRPLAVAQAVEKFALSFNLTAKLYGTDVLYMCSKYWIRVDGWWYYVQDPIRKIESISNAVQASDKVEERLGERWISLRDDLRHYDNALVMEALAEAVRIRNGLTFLPMQLLRALATFASSREAYFNSYGPEEFLG